MGVKLVKKVVWDEVDLIDFIDRVNLPNLFLLSWRSFAVALQRTNAQTLVIVGISSNSDAGAGA